MRDKLNVENFPIYRLVPDYLKFIYMKFIHDQNKGYQH